MACLCDLRCVPTYWPTFSTDIRNSNEWTFRNDGQLLYDEKMAQTGPTRWPDLSVEMLANMFPGLCLPLVNIGDLEHPWVGTETFVFAKLSTLHEFPIRNISDSM